MAITQTPQNYSNLVSGRLAAAITAAQTTGVTVTADTYQIGSAAATPVTFPTGTMILKLTRKTRTKTQVEYVSVDSGTTQSGSTVTLGTIVRDISTSSGSGYSTVTGGLAFPAGTIVELVYGVHQAEKTAFLDTANSFTATQTFTAPIVVSGTTSYLKVPSLTTSQRTALSASNGMIVYDSDLAVLYQYIGGAWSTFATGSVTAASNTVAGKVDIATAAEVTAGTATDATSGAINVIPVSITAVTSAGAGDAGKIPALNASGLINVASGGTGAATHTANNVLVGAGTSAITSIAPSTAANVLRSNGTTWASAGHGQYRGKIFKSITEFFLVDSAALAASGLNSGATMAASQFDGAGGTETALVTLALPDDYTAASTITVQFWIGGGTGGTCVWGAEAAAFTDAELGAAFGTQQIISDVITADQYHLTAVTPAITIAGTPAAGDICTIRVQRISNHASDTLAADVGLRGIIINYTVA